MRPGPARRGKHLIIEFARIVFGEEFGHEFSLSPPLRRANQKGVRCRYYPARCARSGGLDALLPVCERTSRKNGAVRLTRLFATCSGVPVATISPPASPASGPIS